MVELLKYMNNMLEQVVANSRLPSGQNPLQQLVLIIADGRFHDNKEKVKRCIRDLLHRNCMVAFIVLDSAQESLVDCKVSFSPFAIHSILIIINAGFTFIIILPSILSDHLFNFFSAIYVKLAMHYIVYM